MAGSSFSSSVVNLIKICIGTGILALPYSFACGGLLTAPLFLALVARWNAFSVDRLLSCERLVPPPLPASPGCSQGGKPCCSLGDVARGAFGRGGRYLVDCTIATLLVGVCISYQVAASSFMLSDPLLSFGSSASNSGLLFVPLLSLCLFSNIASLSKFSFLGLLSIAFSFVVITIHGVSENGFRGFSEPTVPLLPPSLSTFAVYYGTASFCYGITPVTFPMKSSMCGSSERSGASEAERAERAK
jgi:amino acid permease